MATTWKAPTWRMPNEKNQSKFESYSLNFDSAGTDHIFLVNSSQVSSEFSGIGNANSYSFSFWINTTDSTSLGSPAWYSDVCILELRTETGSGTKVPFNIGMNGGKLFFGRTSNHTTSDQYFESTTLVNTGSWVHCVVTVEVNTLKFYINNSLDSTHTFTVATGDCSVGSTNSNFIIASRTTNAGAASAPFPGKISNINIFDYLLSSTQVSSLYNSGSPINPMTIKPAPIAYYPLGGNASTGGDPLTATTPNTLSVPNIAVPDASVFDFGGSNNEKITTGNSSLLDGASAASFSLWVKGKTGLASYDGMLCFRSGSDYILIIARGTITATEFPVWIQQSGGGVTTNTSNAIVPLNEWNHIVIVGAVGGKWNIYVNGELSSTQVQDTNNIAAISQASPFLIGHDFTTRDFVGEISNVQIWNTELSTAEITTLYNNGVPLLTGTQPEEANLKAWYKLDQSANWEADTAGNWQIPDAVSSYPQSFDFGDAISNPKKFIEVSRAAVNVTDAICVSAWVKTQKNTPSEGNGQRQAIISNYYSGDIPNNGCWKFHIGDGWANGYTKMTFWCRPASEAAVFSVSQTSGQVITDNTWHHVVVLWNGTTTADAVKIFVDGLLAGQGTASATSPIATSTTSRPSLGKSAADSTGVYGNGYYLGGPAGKPGFLSNVQVWDTALTYGTVSSIGDTAGGQVAQLYNNGVPLTTAIATDNLKGWWKLDNTEFYDTFNTTNKWMINNNGLSTDFNKCFWMNPLAIQVPSTLGYQDGTNAFSGAAWVNISSGNVAIIARQRGRISSTGAYPGWSFSTVGSGAAQGDPEFWLTTNTNGTIRIKSLSYTLQDGKWHFVAFTYDGSQDVSGVKIYVDGYEDTFRQSLQNNLTGTMSDYNTPFMIGGTYRQGNFNNARTGSNQFMSNAMYFESELSASDILTLYNNGTPLNDLSSFTTLKGWWKLDDTATYGNGWTIPDASGNGNTGTSDSTMPSTNRVNLLPTTSNGLSSGMTEQNLVNNNVSVLNGESSGMTSANLVTSTLTRQVPYNSYSLNFDAGNPDYILTSFAPASYTGFSVSAWVYADSLGSFNVVASQYRNGDPANSAWFLETIGSNMAFGVANGSSLAYATKAFSTGGWYHIVGVWNGSTAEVYIDGAASGSPVSISGMNTGTVDMAIGALWDTAGTSIGGGPWDGKISNISVFNQALTSTEVVKLYNSGVPGDLSNFNPTPVSWWSLGSDSYFNGANYICPDLVGSNNGTSSGMDANALIGDAPNSTGNGTSTNMAIDANLTGSAPNSSNNSFSVNMDYADRVEDVAPTP